MVDAQNLLVDKMPKWLRLPRAIILVKDMDDQLHNVIHLPSSDGNGYFN